MTQGPEFLEWLNGKVWLICGVCWVMAQNQTKKVNVELFKSQVWKATHDCLAVDVTFWNNYLVVIWAFFLNLGY